MPAEHAPRPQPAPASTRGRIQSAQTTAPARLASPARPDEPEPGPGSHLADQLAAPNLHLAVDGGRLRRTSFARSSDPPARFRSERVRAAPGRPSRRGGRGVGQRAATRLARVDLYTMAQAPRPVRQCPDRDSCLGRQVANRQPATLALSQPRSLLLATIVAAARLQSRPACRHAAIRSRCLRRTRVRERRSLQADTATRPERRIRASGGGVAISPSGGVSLVFLRLAGTEAGKRRPGPAASGHSMGMACVGRAASV